MPSSVLLVRIVATLCAASGLMPLAAGINYGDLEAALLSIPFFAGAALLWGFSDIISLLQRILAAMTEHRAPEDTSATDEMALHDKPVRSPQEIASDLARLRGNVSR